MTDQFVVCGWFTPDYRHFWNSLRKELDTAGIPHDFVERRKADGGWEANTQRKAAEILAAMDRNPGKTIIFTDVDCSIRDAAALAHLPDIPGDVAFYLRTRRSRFGLPRSHPRTGTMVFRPTPQARFFVERWRDASISAPRFSVDQETLPIALGAVPGLSVTYLDVRYCAVPADKCEHPVVLHQRSRQRRRFKKTAKLSGRILWLLQRKYPRRIPSDHSPVHT